MGLGTVEHWNWAHWVSMRNFGREGFGGREGFEVWNFESLRRVWLLVKSSSRSKRKANLLPYILIMLSFWLKLMTFTWPSAEPMVFMASKIQIPKGLQGLGFRA